MDPLSDVLALLKPRSALSARLMTSGDWALHFPGFGGVKFTAVVQGSCCLQIRGVPQPIALKTGDCYLLTNGRPYRLGGDLALMHNDPVHRWSVNELAKAAGMSRSTFAQRFKDRVGVAPFDYLLRWRMRLAARALQETGKAVSEVGQQLDYTSESALSNAFKRSMGQAPTHYRARHLAAEDA